MTSERFISGPRGPPRDTLLSSSITHISNALARLSSGHIKPNYMLVMGHAAPVEQGTTQQL
jgi:hypothetical protein